MNRRLKPISLILGLVLSALTLLSWTMTWFVIVVAESGDARQTMSITGETAAPALAALGLAGLALVAALAIAGRVFRVVLGLLQAAIGVSIGISAWGALADPVAASTPLVTQATGISGGESVDALVVATTVTPWPAVTIAIGVLLIATGLFILVTARNGPDAASRYQSVRLEEADAPRSAVSDWDSLSDGSDPTSR
jgi:uncharacterized membrane protein (TIGR02234 family)